MPANVPAAVYQLKIKLRHAKPAIWRRIRLAGSTTLEDLHYIAQISMGWSNSHLHMFVTDSGQCFGSPEQDMDDLLEMLDEREMTVAELLHQPNQHLTYEYDFGDGWEHEVLLEKILAPLAEEPLPRCVHAQGKCPPEDVGGIGGFYAFLQAMRDPRHPEHEDVLAWWGEPEFDPDEVDVDAINQRLQTPAAIMQQRESDEGALDDFHGLSPDRMHQLLYTPYDSPQWLQWRESEQAAQAPILRMAKVLLSTLADKEVKLTPKGNLPVVLVKAMLAAVDEQQPLLGFPHPNEHRYAEENVMPVHATRLLVQLAGLTKTQKGKLSLKKTSATDVTRGHWGKAYLKMLKAMMLAFNWAYLDGYAGLRGVQTTSPFTLWLIHRHGADWQPESFYSGAILQAFPMLMAEASNESHAIASETLEQLISWRTFKLYQWFGLIELREQAPDSRGFPHRGPLSLRATKLFDAVLAFS
jgi:hypothetical protein